MAMGIGRLVSGLMDSGQLVAPFCASTLGMRAYYIVRSAITRERPHVRALVDWLMQEARAAMEDEACCSPRLCAPTPSEGPQTCRPH